MTDYFLGVDVGGTKSHALISDTNGNVVGFGAAGSGNWESIGFDEYCQVVESIITSALQGAGIELSQIKGAGFGLAGYDWPSQQLQHVQSIAAMGLKAAYEIVNDVELGIYAGTSAGWGVSVEAGTGCNCRGWTRGKERYGRMVGGGLWSGETVGTFGLVFRAMQAATYAWNKRGPDTLLADMLVTARGACDLTDLVEGVYLQRYPLLPQDAALVFEAAQLGDMAAREILIESGTILGEMAGGVIRQLEIQNHPFEVVLIGSLFKGSSLMQSALEEEVTQLAPQAVFKSLQTPPVIGAVLLGMEVAGQAYGQAREHLLESGAAYIAAHEA